MLALGVDCPTSAVRYALEQLFEIETEPGNGTAVAEAPMLVIDVNGRTSEELDQIDTVDHLAAAVWPLVERMQRDSDAQAVALRGIRDALESSSFHDAAADQSFESKVNELLGRIVQPHLPASTEGEWVEQTSWSGPDFKSAMALIRYNLEGVEDLADHQHGAATATLRQLPQFVPALELLWTEPGITKPYVHTVRAVFDEFFGVQGDDSHAAEIQADLFTVIASAIAALNKSPSALG
ncbi:MAG: hypothetical protein M3N46_04710 [Actinomycetota bacterium]|nr:hypothetical protein [Actinomycetota bacterium]